MRKHSIDILFPLILLCVFALCACGLVLVSVRSYERMVARADENYNTRTIAAYLREKTAGADTAGAVTITDFDGAQALKLSSEGYATYIYYYDGNLCEIYLAEGAEASREAGTAILPAGSVTFSFANDSLLDVELREDGESSHTYIALLSDAEVQP